MRTTTSTARPLKTFRAGSLQAALWPNKRVTLQRSWKDDATGEWQHEQVSVPLLHVTSAAELLLLVFRDAAIAEQSVSPQQ